MNNTIKARGAVNIQIFKDGKLIDTIIEDNLVVLLGKQNICRMIGGHADGKKFTDVSIGTSGVAPAPGDNAITAPFTKPFEAVTYPTDNSVMFAFDIDNGEANGMSILEFGLLNEDGVLCARKVRSEAIVKTIAIRLVGTWTITVN